MLIKKPFMILALFISVFLFSLPGAAIAAGLSSVTEPPEEVLIEANAVAKRIGQMDYDFFVETNELGQVLRYGELAVPGGSPVNYLVWGPWHSDPAWDGEGTTKPDRNGTERARYIGYGYEGERVSNVFFPPDRPGGWRRLDEADFIAEPWKNLSVRATFPQFFSETANRFDGSTDADLIKVMRAGLWWCALGNEFVPPDPGSDLYQNPQKYIHVFLTMSDLHWGMGVMFHRDPDGSLWYRSVPLAWKLPVPDDAISLTPAERTGKPGDKITFTLNVSWSNGDALKELCGYYGFDCSYIVRVTHRVGGNNYAPLFTLDGAQGQEVTPGWSELVFDGPPDSASKSGTIEVTVQNVPSEVVAQIVPCIRYRDTGSVFLLTDLYLFKEAAARISANFINLGIKSLYIVPDPGTPGGTSIARGVACNEYAEAFSDVPVILYVDKIYQGSTVVSLPAATEAGPGEASFEIRFPTPEPGEHKVEAVINPARLVQTEAGRKKLDEWGLQVPDIPGMKVIPEGY